MNTALSQWRQTLRSHAAFSAWFADNGAVLDEQWRPTIALQAALRDAAASASVPGYCWICQAPSRFLYDLQYSNGHDVNWRERLVCTGCGLNNRLRLTVQVIDAEGLRGRGYLTEHVTPLARLLRDRFPGLVTSEYLGPEHAPGQVSRKGIRHEDLRGLSLADAATDFVVSCDVLEHIADYGAALRELARILVPGGLALITVPFLLHAADNLVRARLEGGQVVHLLEPEYHGDPVGGQGVLCYYHFGWQLLEDLRQAGFADAWLDLYWSADYANLGGPQVFVMARR
ncbi:MAG TPA: methyltransferase domain-containing protein [Thermomonas sp.]|nr:methyltransferase domain-containing protein [Thermomonas sp.]